MISDISKTFHIFEVDLFDFNFFISCITDNKFFMYNASKYIHMRLTRVVERESQHTNRYFYLPRTTTHLITTCAI